MRCADKALPAFGLDVDWYTTRERTYEEVLPWDHLDSGLDKDWLWEDWQDSLDETEVEDCRWTPCFDCGVCPPLEKRRNTRRQSPGQATARRPAARTRGAAHPFALHQARPPPVHQPPRLPARLRACAAPRRGAHGVLGGVHAASEGVVRQCRTHRHGQ